MFISNFLTVKFYVYVNALKNNEWSNKALFYYNKVLLNVKLFKTTHLYIYVLSFYSGNKDKNKCILKTC